MDNLSKWYSLTQGLPIHLLKFKNQISFWKINLPKLISKCSVSKSNRGEFITIKYKVTIKKKWNRSWIISRKIINKKWINFKL